METEPWYCIFQRTKFGMNAKMDSPFEVCCTLRTSLKRDFMSYSIVLDLKDTINRLNQPFEFETTLWPGKMARFLEVAASLQVHFDSDSSKRFCCSLKKWKRIVTVRIMVLSDLLPNSELKHVLKGEIDQQSSSHATIDLFVHFWCHLKTFARQHFKAWQQMARIGTNWHS